MGTGALVAERGELVSRIAGHDCNAGKGGHQKEQVRPQGHRWYHLEALAEKHFQHPGTHFQLLRQS